MTSANLERSYRRAPKGAKEGDDGEWAAGICHLCLGGSTFDWENLTLCVCFRKLSRNIKLFIYTVYILIYVYRYTPVGITNIDRKRVQVHRRCSCVYIYIRILIDTFSDPLCIYIYILKVCIITHTHIYISGFLQCLDTPVFGVYIFASFDAKERC